MPHLKNCEVRELFLDHAVSKPGPAQNFPGTPVSAEPSSTTASFEFSSSSSSSSAASASASDVGEAASSSSSS
jgi:hypothetical protein